MKKTKTQKGITLVALIITIVVLLILAVVAIGAVQESNIIGHAQNAAGKFNQSKANEIADINNYEDLIEEYTKTKYTFTLNELGDYEKSADSIIEFKSSNVWKAIAVDLSKNNEYCYEKQFAFDSENILFDSVARVLFLGKEINAGAQFLVGATLADEDDTFCFMVRTPDGAELLTTSSIAEDGKMTHDEFMRLYGDVEFTFVDISSLGITIE